MWMIVGGNLAAFTHSSTPFQLQNFLWHVSSEWWLLKAYSLLQPLASHISIITWFPRKINFPSASHNSRKLTWESFHRNSGHSNQNNSENTNSFEFGAEVKHVSFITVQHFLKFLVSILIINFPCIGEWVADPDPDDVMYKFCWAKVL